jgi:hypothetical protein
MGRLVYLFSSCFWPRPRSPTPQPCGQATRSASSNATSTSRQIPPPTLAACSCALSAALRPQSCASTRPRLDRGAWRAPPGFVL